MTIQSIKGMHDLLPSQAACWRYLENLFIEIVSQYGYGELRLPILEKTELFARTIGATTDIVEKEMYSFEDRNGDNLTLRPEGTAGVVRACIEHSLTETPKKLWYTGPMFRHERPQKGRLRQFHQFGVEVFGYQGPDVDAELIAMTARFWDKAGVAEAVELNINSLGSPEARMRHKEALTDFLSERKQDLDTDSQRRLQTNPLRILDSKHPRTQELLIDAPNLLDYLDDESKSDFEQLCRYLDRLGISYRVNPKLVRGLDYYNKTVFEWTTSLLGAQSTVCGGGRYDGLMTQLGGKPTPALGMGMGIERLILLLEAVKSLPNASNQSDIYVVYQPGYFINAAEFAEKIRDQVSGRAVRMHFGDASFKAQFKHADRSGAGLAVILGEVEIAENRVSVKFLRDRQDQQTLSQTDFLDAISKEDL